MKGYAEHRGVQSRLVYDAETGDFRQRRVPHAFGPIPDGAAPPPDAEVIALPRRRVAARQQPGPEGQGTAYVKRSAARKG